MANLSIFFDSLSILQYFLTSFALSSEFVKIPSFLYLSSCKFLASTTLFLMAKESSPSSFIFNAVVLYVLRLIYESEKTDSSQANAGIYITTSALIKTMLEFNVPFQGKRLTGRSIAKSLRLLANRNIINKVSGSYDEGNVSFYILPSIVYAIDNNKIQAMADAISRINEEKEKVDLTKFQGGDF